MTVLDKWSSFLPYLENVPGERYLEWYPGFSAVYEYLCLSDWRFKDIFFMLIMNCKKITKNLTMTCVIQSLHMTVKVATRSVKKKKKKVPKLKIWQVTMWCVGLTCKVVFSVLPLTKIHSHVSLDISYGN